MSVQITSVTFEHHTEFLGIPEASPRISWRFQGDVQNWSQESYEIEVNYGDDTQAETFSTESSTSVLVPWPSKPLNSGQSATVRVRSSGTGGTTPWSDPQTIEAALLHPEDWNCELVETSRNLDSEATKRPVLFRRDFTISKEVAKARLYITAHGIYEPEINGQRVGDHILAPGWTVYDKELSYQTFDVTNNLRADEGGHNSIGVTVAEGWYAGRLGFLGGKRNIWGNHLGVIAQLVISFIDGSTTTIATDSNWKYESSPVIYSSLYDGELFDQNEVKTGWSSPGYDDSAWQSVSTRSHDPTILRAPDSSPIRHTEDVPVVKVLESRSGKAILDFGQNLVGWIRFKIPTGPQGQKISLVHTEVLEHGECATRPLRIAKATDELVLSGKNTETFWNPRFTFHGFRYVEVNGWPGELKPDDFTAIVIHTEMRKTGTFECSNPLLNRLHQNVIWSMKGNFVGIPTDCPQRDERLGWTGDIQAFAPTAGFLYGCHGMLKTWLRGLAAEQKAGGNGSPPLVSPNVISIPVEPVAIWGDCAVLVPWDLYESSGDRDLLASQFESMELWLEKGIPRTESGLWADTTLGQLGDWLDPAAPTDAPGKATTDPTLVADAFLIRSTDVMAKVCNVLGHTSKEQTYLEQAKSLRKAFATEYITESGRIMSNSQTAIALAIQFSLFPSEKQQEYAVLQLNKLILNSARFKIATGFAGTPVIGHALKKVGKEHLFYRMLLNKQNPSWLYPVTMGATTIWERWDSMLPDGTINPGEMTSFNHYALGAVADWMHTVIGGIKSLEPGWKKFLIEPIPGGKLTHANTTFDSPYGVIRSEWKIVDGKFNLTVQIPPNTTAEVVVLGQEKKTLGSGTYVFAVDYVEPERPMLPPANPFSHEVDDGDSLAP